MHPIDCPDCGVRSRASCASAERPTQRRLARARRMSLHTGSIPRTSVVQVVSPRVRARSEPAPEWESLLGRAMPCSSHLLAFRSVALGSLGSAKRRAICVSNPLQSCNTHAKLQTTPHTSESTCTQLARHRRHARSTTQTTAVAARMRPEEIARTPTPRKADETQEFHQKKSSEIRRSPAGGNQRGSRPRTPLVGRKTRSWVILVCAQRGSSLEH